MRLNSLVAYILFIFSALIMQQTGAQEMVAPVRWNPYLSERNAGANLVKHKAAAKKTTASLTLPFFEDFSTYDQYPDTNKWADFEVYVNNTMAVSPVTRGVATFDDLNSLGIPYDSFSNTIIRYADSLTSKPIDLSTTTVGDSVYLSFFYQPQGNGFYPLLGDSLMLFARNKFGDFIKIWSVGGTTLQPFQQVMIPILDTLDFHENFQFRFINKAALFWADAVWNIDYIRLDKNRNINDTAVNDIAFTTLPTLLLNDYTSMPYSQFKVNPAAEIVSNITDSVRNDSTAGHTANYAYVVKDGTFTLAGSTGFTSIFIGGGQTGSIIDGLSIAGYPSHPANSQVVYQTTYYLENDGTTGPTANDTAVRDQVFDNYLAYDDGTAEKSYYLNLFPSQPGKIAIEYHLNKPDTLRGIAVYFGRQIPFSSTKPFIARVYSALAHINGAPADHVIYSSDILTPAYADSVNHFWTYIFDQPQAMPAGIFYMGTVQSENDGSDSLYYGLDVNRVGDNHAYYNVLGNWSPSLISGAIMMRPIIGRAVSGSSVGQVTTSGESWHIAPNPASNQITFRIAGDGAAVFQITDITGHLLQNGTASNGQTADISSLVPGMYFVTLSTNGIVSAPQKFIKL